MVHTQNLTSNRRAKSGSNAGRGAARDEISFISVRPKEGEVEIDHLESNRLKLRDAATDHSSFLRVETVNYHSIFRS